MRKRYDYRNVYKDMTKEDLLEYLTALKQRLLDNIGIIDTSNELKRICYIENKLNTKYK